MLIVLVGVALGTGWWMSSRQTEEPMDAATRVPERTVEDQRLVDSVLESPEQLDASVAASVGLNSPEPGPVADSVAATPRPQLCRQRWSGSRCRRRVSISGRIMPRCAKPKSGIPIPRKTGRALFH